MAAAPRAQWRVKRPDLRLLHEGQLALAGPAQISSGAGRTFSVTSAFLAMAFLADSGQFPWSDRGTSEVYIEFLCLLQAFAPHTVMLCARPRSD